MPTISMGSTSNSLNKKGSKATLDETASTSSSSKDLSKVSKLDDRFIFEKKTASSSNSAINLPSHTSSKDSQSSDSTNLSSHFIESMVHLGYFEENMLGNKDPESASIRSLPSNYKNKKRNIFGINFKNKKRTEEDKNSLEKSNRYFGMEMSPYKTAGGEAPFGIDLTFNPQDMDGIVDPKLLSNQSSKDEFTASDEPKKNILGSLVPHQHQGWRPPESWNSRRKPSIATEDDRTLEQQLSLESDQMYFMRVFRRNETFVTIPCKLNDRVKDICQLLAKKLHVQDSSQYGMYIRKLGKGERMLYSLEKPVKILVRLLTTVGYQTDELTDMIREDNSYLCQFVYREASMNSSTMPPDEPLPAGDPESISMKSLNLETVPVSLYRVADRIKTLDISQNLLLDFPLDFAQLCISLCKLKLCRNEYQQIPASLCSLKGLRVLDLSNNWISQLGSGQLHLLGDLDQLILCNNQIQFIPDDYAILSRLTVLDLSNNCLEAFPLPICNMPQLRHLNLSYNRLREIPALFGELAHLQSLFLVCNQLLGELPSCFENLVSLATLDIRKNLLSDIAIVSTISKLETLRCDQNQLTSVVLDNPKLTQLTLSNTRLSKFQATSMERLIDLNLDDCQLEQLPLDFFDCSPNLVSLRLSNNKLSAIPCQSLTLLSRLEVFQCANNRLETLPDELFSLPRLLQVDVHNNRLKKLPPTIWSSLSLYFFNASSNALVAFPVPPNPAPSISNSGAHLAVKPRFSSLALALKLRHLILADNRLTEDVFSPISYLTQLNVLNLSCNDIYEVPPGGLYNLVNITELYLSCNQIASFPAEEVERLRHLKVFYLNSNKLPSLPAEMRKLGKLVVLDVASNQLNYNISNWNYDWNWNCNKELRYLNLSGNKRLKIYKPGLFNGVNKDSPLADFQNLPHLRVLGLIDLDVNNVTLEQTSRRRVRSYSSVVNQVGFGIADRLDRSESLCSWDFVVPNFRELETESLFGIFDLLASHQGETRRVGKYLSDWTTFHLTSELRKFEKSEASDPISRALRCTFLDLQREAVSTYGHDQREGASALIAYRKGHTLYLAHIGDALAVVSRKGKVRFACEPHVPTQLDAEITRIRQAGGFITGDGRVNGETRLSRSFGLFHHLPVINANPSVEQVELNEYDELLILASRGLWDVMAPQTAVDIARTEMEDPGLAAQKLRDFAIAYGAEGSIMVMVVGIGDLFNRRLQLERRLTRNPRLDSTQFLNNISGPADERRMMQYGNWKKIRNHPAEARPPVGQIVIVFTGIKNTTFLWENHPDAMAMASRIHDGILRTVLKQVEGYEVKNEGDTFMASFHSVPSAVLWCCLVQLELLQAEWPPVILSLPDGQEVFDGELEGQLLYRGLSVRMGMNFGDPLCEKDPMTGRMDYFGPMVNKAARVCGEAGFGEVCISSDVLAELMNVEGLFDFEAAPEALSVGSASEEKLSMDVQELRKLSLRLVDIGERKLKGVELPEPLVLVFPKALAGRSNPDRYRTSKQPIPRLSIIPSDEDGGQGQTLVDLVRGLGQLCIRLEAAVHIVTHPNPTLPPAVLQHQMVSSIPYNISSRDLYKTIEILCCRIENSASTLALYHTGPSIPEVLDALREYLTAHHSLVGGNALSPQIQKHQILKSTRYAHLNDTLSPN